MRSSLPDLRGWLFTCCSLAALCLPTTSSAASPSLNDDAAYVGSASCGNCHQAAYEAWNGSHHDLAMQAATPQTVLGNFADVAFDEHGIKARFFVRGENYFIQATDAQGELQDFKVHYVFGVYPLQQYLLALPGGRLQAFRLAWDARASQAGGQRWFALYEGQNIAADDPLHWTGINQNWNSMCAECHVTNFRKNFDLAKRRFSSSFSAEDVGCEACHGPGARHVELAKTEALESAEWPGLVAAFADASPARWLFSEDSPIAGLSTPRTGQAEINTCARCHSRRAVHSENFTPGRDLGQTHALSLLDEDLYHSDGQIDDEVYVHGSFVQSRMYAAGVRCSDCHEPHSLQLRSPGAQVCSQCHQPAHFNDASHHHHQASATSPDCIACHMPGKYYMEVDYRHDHSLRVPRPDLSPETGAPNACAHCHEDIDPQSLIDSFRRWYPERAATGHYGQVLAAGRRGDSQAGQALATLVLQASTPEIVRATALSMLPEYPLPGMQALVEKALASPSPLLRLSAVQVLSRAEPQHRARALPPLLHDPIRIVRMQTARALMPIADQALADKDGAAFQRALRENTDSQHLNAERAFAHLNLASLALDQSRPTQAELSYRTALDLEPWAPEAWVNLADLLRANSRDDEALALLRKALAENNEAPALHHALGLALIRAGQRQQALAALKQASDLAPANTRYSYVYAVALHSTGQAQAAIALLKKAHAQRPIDTDVLGALLSYQRAAGDRAAALETARTLHRITPWNRELGALIVELQKASKPE